MVSRSTWINNSSSLSVWHGYHPFCVSNKNCNFLLLLTVAGDFRPPWIHCTKENRVTKSHSAHQNQIKLIVPCNSICLVSIYNYYWFLHIDMFKHVQTRCTELYRCGFKKHRKHCSTAAQPSSHTWKPTKSMGPAFWWILGELRDGLSWCNWDITGIEVSEISPLNW